MKCLCVYDCDCVGAFFVDVCCFFKCIHIYCGVVVKLNVD